MYETTPSIVCWIRIRSLLLQELPLDLEIYRASDYEPWKILARRVNAKGMKMIKLSIRAEWSSIGFPFRFKAVVTGCFVVEEPVYGHHLQICPYP